MSLGRCLSTLPGLPSPMKVTHLWCCSTCSRVLLGGTQYSSSLSSSSTLTVASNQRRRHGGLPFLGRGEGPTLPASMVSHFQGRTSPVHHPSCIKGLIFLGTFLVRSPLAVWEIVGKTTFKRAICELESSLFLLENH